MIRTVYVPVFGRNVSTLGFGCASLGSRVSAKNGANALDRAFDMGIDWYDVAPSYGDGEAEATIGKVFSNRRSRIVIATKLGILPGKSSVKAKLIKPIARKAISMAPFARKYLARLRPQAVRVPISAELIENSIVVSLQNLRTDYVDVLALHEPTIDEISNPAVLAALEMTLARGQVRALSIAGQLEVVVHALKTSSLFKIAQIANSPFLRPAERLHNAAWKGKDLTAVTFGIFGHQGPLETLKRQLDQDAALREKFANAGYLQTSSVEISRAYLLDYALASNSDGVTLASMYSRGHLELNASRAAQALNSNILTLADHLSPSR